MDGVWSGKVRVEFKQGAACRCHNSLKVKRLERSIKEGLLENRCRFQRPKKEVSLV